MRALVIAAVLFVSTASGQLLPDQRQHTLLVAGIRLTLEQRYDSAETIFRSMIREWPEHPSGYLYLAGMMQARYTDYGDTFNERRYDSLLSAAAELGERMEEREGGKAAGLFYQGASDAFRSFTASEGGNLPTGFYYGVSAGGLLERCLEADPGYTQAKNILGAYYYWRSTLAWIPFVTDRTEEGISFIKQTLSHPYERHLASHNLMLVLIDEERYAEAESCGLAMLAQYPDNRSFLWNMVTVYERWERRSDLDAVVRRLLESALRAPVVNRYTEAMCRLKMAQYAASLGDRATARRECLAVIGLRSFIGRTRGDLRAKVTAAERLLSELGER